MDLTVEMIPQGVHKIGQSSWLDVREHPSNLNVITCENESMRPTLLPYETRVQDHSQILHLLHHTEHVIILCENTTTLPSEITEHPSCIIRRYPKERLQRQVPRNVWVWIQWFPHSDPDRAKEFQTAFEQNVKCEHVHKIIQLSEEDYSKEYSFLEHEKVNIIPHETRITYNSFFKLLEDHSSEPYDFHVLVNADMEWTQEASLGLEHCLWETGKFAICPLRWEDRKTIFRIRADSQDCWGFVRNSIPSANKMKRDIPLGNPGCDNRILMELLLQGFQTLNHPLQFPTIHHHKTEIRNYTRKDQIPQPYLLVRPQWYCPLMNTSKPELNHSWLPRACMNVRNRVSPLISDTQTNEFIGNAIREKKGFSIGKIGQIEAEALAMFIQGAAQERQAFGTAQSRLPDRIMTQLHVNAGIFPNDMGGVEAFTNIYQNAMSACDILSVSYPWLIPGWGEYLKTCRGGKTNQISCRIPATEPFFVPNPFTRELTNKKVTVISPFVKSFQSQLEKRRDVWGERAEDFLPSTTQWSFVKAPLSAGIVPPIDEDWGSMIERLIDECFPSNREHEWPDVILAGCGPGGLCLCQAAKERGKVGISMGGGLQILFGVRGKRWDQNPKFQNFINDSWVRPSGEERPPENVRVERGCYW
jgi:hypothetical protein